MGTILPPPDAGSLRGLVPDVRVALTSRPFLRKALKLFPTQGGLFCSWVSYVLGFVQFLVLYICTHLSLSFSVSLSLILSLSCCYVFTLGLGCIDDAFASCFAIGLAHRLQRVAVATLTQQPMPLAHELHWAWL